MRGFCTRFSVQIISAYFPCFCSFVCLFGWVGCWCVIDSPSSTENIQKMISSIRSTKILFQQQQAISLPSIGIITRSYHSNVLEHYERPRNVGSMDKKDPLVGTGLVGAPACGDVMKLQIRVDPLSRRITDVKFKTFGCGSAIASSSFATERIRGMTLEEAGAVKNTVIAKELSLPPVKLHCSMLAEDAVKAAIRDFLHKNPKLSAVAEEVEFAVENHR